MWHEHDYYAILGVTRDAPEAEIRRAFRTLAKALHPDSNRAAGAIPGYDFSLLTEAYETLKDESRRKAYDVLLNQARQVAAQSDRGGSSRGFAAGIAVGIVFALLAVGAKIYIDRVGFRTALPKSQESLRVQRTENMPAVAASEPPAAEESAGRALPSTPNRLSQSSGIDKRTASLSRPVPLVPDRNEGQPQDKASGPEANTVPLSTLSPFAQSVLRLENTVDSEGDRAAALRLVSLIKSATDTEDLSRTMSVVSKPETRELLNSRIVEVKQSQAALPIGEDAAQRGAQAQPAALKNGGSASRPSDNAPIEVVAGIKPKETVLRLSLGNGRAESFTDCSNCPELVVVPSGHATIGSRPLNDGYRAEEGPAHRIFVRKPFAVSKYGVSVANWQACVEAGACRPTLFALLAAGPRVPVARVSWFDAKAYVDWLSQSTGHQYRLLSEAEWEYLARKGSARVPSGPVARSNGAALATIKDAGGLALHSRLRPVSDAPSNAWGLHAIGGSIMEWVEDCWHPDYDQAPSDASPWLSNKGGDCAYRVVRGGMAEGVEFGGRRPAARAREFADTRSPTLGFRVARNIPVPTKTALEVR